MRSKRKTSDSSEFYFDDCMICQGTKHAEETGEYLSVEELQKLFKKANKGN